MRWLLTLAQSSTSTPPGLSMKTRTSRPPGDVSQSTSSYPIGGSVLSSNSPRFTAPPKTPVPKKNGLSSPFLILIRRRIIPEIEANLKGTAPIAASAASPTCPDRRGDGQDGLLHRDHAV